MGILSQEQVALLTDYDTNSAYSAAYRTIYANIQFNWAKNETLQHTILLTTPVDYPGQAAAAANVAIAAAQSGTPTVVIDADLAHPTLHQRFGTGDVAGLGNLLTDQETITPQSIAAHLCKTFIPELRVLGAGNAAQASIGLQHTQALRDIIDATRRFLADTEQKTSLVLFAGPPVQANVDAALISTQVDQTFLTIVAGHTTRKQAKQAQEQLERAHAQLTGIILLDK